MKQLKWILSYLMVILLFSTLEGAALTPVKTIGGDDDDNYVFMRISGGVISHDKNIYVLDSKGHFIARYDWNGRFIKKTGTKGEGPGSFKTPLCLDIFAEKLFFLDGLNGRAVEVDLELKHIEYHKFLTSTFFIDDFFCIGGKKFIGVCLPNYDSEEYNFIKTIDFANLTENTFFSASSYGINKKQKSPKNLHFSRPCVGIDRTAKQVVIAPRYPGPSIRFFIYSLEGECLDSFSHTFDKDYSLPDFIVNGKRPPSEFTSIMVYAIFVHKNHYIVHIGKTRFENRWPVEDEMEKYFLIFDAKTWKFKQRLPVPGKLEIFSISSDGYLIGTNSYEDIPKVYIHRLQF